MHATAQILATFHTQALREELRAWDLSTNSWAAQVLTHKLDEDCYVTTHECYVTTHERESRVNKWKLMEAVSRIQSSDANVLSVGAGRANPGGNVTNMTPR